MYAKIAYFYGWTPDVIDQLDIDTLNAYWEAITVIEAQDTLLQLNVAAYPWMKKEKRQAYHRRIHKLAYPNNSGKVVDGLDAAKMLGIHINGK